MENRPHKHHSAGLLLKVISSISCMAIIAVLVVAGIHQTPAEREKATYLRDMNASINASTQTLESKIELVASSREQIVELSTQNQESYDSLEDKIVTIYSELKQIKEELRDREQDDHQVITMIETIEGTLTEIQDEKQSIAEQKALYDTFQEMTPEEFARVKDKVQPDEIVTTQQIAQQ